MTCPTCGVTMASIGYCNGGTVYNCERCGTVKHSGPFIDPPLIYVPKLVERCRQFERTLLPYNQSAISHADEWHRLGVEESINLPANRPAFGYVIRDSSGLYWDSDSNLWVADRALATVYYTSTDAQEEANNFSFRDSLRIERK